MSLDRLHEQVSNLARRFEPKGINPLDDFERLGKALSGSLDFTAGGRLSGGRHAKPVCLDPSAFPRASPPLAETAGAGLFAPPFAHPLTSRRATATSTSVLSTWRADSSIRSAW